VLEIELNTLAY